MRPIIPVLLLALASCDPLDDEKDELRAARERWDDAGITSYAFTFTYECYCMRAGVYAVVVADDSIESIEIVSPAWDEGQEPYALTVPQMFERLADALERGPDDVRLEFASAGYPEAVYFDMVDSYADDEWGFEVEGLTPLEP